MSRSARLLAVLITLHLILIAAQTTDVSCVASSSTAFLFNVEGESPCLVWAKLQSLCIPSTSSVNIPSLLGAGYGYLLPNGDSTACQCNSVAYNLMAGCTYCQFRDASSIVSESTFSSACRTYEASGLDFDETVLPVPAYAWKAWNGQTWIPARAAVAASSYATVSYPEGHPTTLSRSFAAAHKSDTSSPAMIITSSTSTLSLPSSSSSYDGTSRPDGSTPSSTPSLSFNSESPSASASSASTSPSLTASHRSAIIAGSVLGAAAFLSLIILFLVRRYRERSKVTSFSPPGRLSPSHPRPLDSRAAQEAFSRHYGHDPRSILSFSDIPPGGAPRFAQDAHLPGEEEIWTGKDGYGAATRAAFEHPRTAPLAEDQIRDNRWRYTGETGYTRYTPHTGRSGYTQRTGGEVGDDWTDDEGEYEDEYADHYHDQEPGTAPNRLAAVQPAPAGQIGRSPVLPNPHRDSTPPQRQPAERQSRSHEYSPQNILTGKQRILNQLSPPPSRPSHPSSVAADTNHPSPGPSTYPESVDFSVQIPTPAISRPGSKYRPSTRYTQGPFLDPFRNPSAGRNQRLTSDLATLPSLYDPGTAAQFRSQPRYSEESRYPPTAQTDAERQKWAATPLPPIPSSQRR